MLLSVGLAYQAPVRRSYGRVAPVSKAMEINYAMPGGLEIPSDVPALDGLLGGEQRTTRDGRKTPSEFELNLGKAIDTLKMDVPDFPNRELQWDIYTDDVVLADPQAVQARGLNSYMQFFSMVRTFRRFMIDDAEVTYKLRYDWSGKRIIVTWYSTWHLKMTSKPAHVDAVSYFHLNEEGKIFKHEVDRVSMNGQDMSPPYGLAWAGLKQKMFDGLDMPVPAAC